MKSIYRNISIILVSVFFLSVLNFSKANGAESIQRLSGIDRYGTAVEISKYGWQQTAVNAVLATSEDFPDALCAAPLAKLLNAPILLSGKAKLDEKTENELKRLSVKNVFIIGGYGVISKSIEDELKSKGFSVIRIYGKDRYETSIAVANYYGVKYGKELFVATGEDFPDALSAAAIAAKKGVPIVLTTKSVPYEEIIKYIKNNGIIKTYVIGGPSVISENVKQQYSNSERIYGSNRYATNMEVIKRFSDELSFETTYLATGNDYPDALSGSALASLTSSPVILVDKVYQNSIKEFIVSKFSMINQIKVLGGEGVVSASVIDYVVPKTVISKIDNIFEYIYKGKNFNLPSKITAVMSNNTVNELPVVWNPVTVDINKPGTYSINGTVSEYGSDVIFNLRIINPTPIMGTPEITDPNKLTEFVRRINPDFNPEIAKAFIAIGNKYGIRGDIAFCQSIHETNWFRFTGDVKADQNNFAGIGATGGVPGHSFATIEEGVTAQMQHLFAYATPAGTPIPGGDPIVDPRFDKVTRGIAPYWEDLGGRWAYPGYSRDAYGSLKEAMVKGATYGQSILKKFEDLKAFKQ